jgi:hypothetical protein
MIVQHFLNFPTTVVIICEDYNVSHSFNIFAQHARDTFFNELYWLDDSSMFNVLYFNKLTINGEWNNIFELKSF